MKKEILSILFLGMTVSAIAGDAGNRFDDYFTDNTLRLDYQLCGDRNGQHIFLSSMSTQPVWAGRRHNLNKLHLEGRGQLTMTSVATGDTLYRTSFCSLFTEWLDTDQAETTARAFEHTVQVPMPKEPVKVSMTLTDPRRQVIAGHSHIVDPSDILIARSARTPLPHRYIHKGGDPRKAIDIAILAEGYSHDQLDLFYKDAERAAESILSHEPFKSRKDDFNFVAVASTTDVADVSKPASGEWVPSAFGSHFSTFYSDRYLTTPNVFSVGNALSGIPYEHIIILANTETYGGGGIYNDYTLTTSRHDAFWPVVTHEFGHSFGALADEYYYDDDVYVNSYPVDIEPWEKNVTTLVDFKDKWENLIPAGTPVPTPAGSDYPVGVYEGGAYFSKGIYRCSADCRMKTNDAEVFCPACQQALDRLIDFYVGK